MPKKKRVIDLENFVEGVTELLYENVKGFLQGYVALSGSKDKLYVPHKAKYYKDDINGLTYPRLVFNASIRELGIHVVTRTNGTGMGYLFKKLKTLYMVEGLDAYTASKKANETLHMFYLACEGLSLEGKPPFISYVCCYDGKKKKDLQQEV